MTHKAQQKRVWQWFVVQGGYLKDVSDPSYDPATDYDHNYYLSGTCSSCGNREQLATTWPGDNDLELQAAAEKAHHCGGLDARGVYEAFGAKTTATAFGLPS